MIRMVCALLGVFAIAFAAGACGDEESGSGDSGQDFTAQVSEICLESTQGVVDANLELGYSQDPKEQEELAERTAALRADATDEIASLDAPEENATQFEDFVAAREELVAADEERVKANASGDEEEIAKAAAAYEKASEAEDAVAADLGAEGCDDQLPEEDAQAAEDAFREFETTAEPETSCDSDTGLVTEPYLEEGFGGVEACEKEQEGLQKNPDQLPEDVEVSKVTGVDGIAAFIEFEDVGGKFDGIPSEATMYYVDGGWKLFSIAEL